MSLFSVGLLAFSPAFVADDWFRMFSFDEASAVAMGRWLKPVVYHAFLGRYFAPGFSTLFMIVATLLATLYMARLFGTTSGFQVFLFAGLILFHPSQTVSHLIYSHHISHGIGFVLIAVFLHLSLKYHDAARRNDRKSTVRHAIAAVIVLTAVAGLRQSLFVFALVMALGIHFHRLLKSLDDEPCSPVSFLSEVLKTVLLFLVGLVLYAATHVLVAKVLFAGSTPGEVMDSHFITSLSELAVTGPRSLRYLGVHLTQGQHLWPLAAKYLFLAIGTSLITTTVFRVRRASGVKKSEKLWLSVLVVSVLFLILLLPWAIGIFTSGTRPYRATGLLALVPVYSIFIVPAIGLQKKKTGARLLSVAALCILTMFMVYQNFGVTSKLLKNRRDFHVMNRILARIESHPAYPELSKEKRLKIILVGEVPGFSLPFEDHVPGSALGDGLGNRGVLNGHPAVFGRALHHIDYFRPRRIQTLFNYPLRRATGRNCTASDLTARLKTRLKLSSVSVPQMKQMLGRIQASPSWPDHGSLIRFGNRFIVKLSPNPAVARALRCLKEK